MPQHWSYGSEVPLTGGRVLVLRAEENSRNIQTQLGGFFWYMVCWFGLFFFFFSRDLLEPVWEGKGFGEKGHYCDTGKKSLYAYIFQFVSCTSSIKAQDSFTTFNDLALYDQQMYFFYWCIYGILLCCVHSAKIIAMHYLL